MRNMNYSKNMSANDTISPTRDELEQRLYNAACENMLLKSQLNQINAAIKNLRNFYEKNKEPGKRTSIGLRIIDQLDEQMLRILGLKSFTKG